MTHWLMRLPSSDEIERVSFNLSLAWGDFHNSLFFSLEGEDPPAVPNHLEARLESLFAQRTVSVQNKLITDELYHFLSLLTGWQPDFVRVKVKKGKKR